MAECGQDAAEDVEDNVLCMPHHVFDVISEDPKIEHVAQKMHPASMQKHTGYQRQCSRDSYDGVIRERGVAEDDGRDRAILKRKNLTRFPRQTFLVEKNRHADGNEDNRDERGPFGGIIIVERDHAGMR